jgi:hypothetical protein
VHPEVVRRLAARGDLVRISRGLYALPDAEATEQHTLATVATRVWAVWLRAQRSPADPRISSSISTHRAIVLSWRLTGPTTNGRNSDM